jgi:outer membrane biosynthesis protein TonB
MFTQPPQIPRSPFASTFTVAFHVGLGLVLLAVSAVPNVPDIVDQTPLTYIMAAPGPDLRFEIPQPPPPAAAPPKPVPRVEIPTPEAPKAIERPVLEKPPVPTPEPERQTIQPPQEIPTPAPPPRPVVVGAFSDASAARTTERKVAVVDAGFAASTTEAARARRELAAVDGFDASVPSSTRRDRPELVANAGFGTAAPDGQVRRATFREFPTDSRGIAAHLSEFSLQDPRSELADNQNSV